MTILLNDLKIRYSKIEKILGFDPLSKANGQGSDGWATTKLGVPSASEASELLKGRDTDGYRSYLALKIAEVCTGKLKQISASSLSWGKENEAAARSAYEFERNEKIHEIPFIYGDEFMRYGCSPDGIIRDGLGLELKCPATSEVHIKSVCFDIIKKEYLLQCQFSMFVTGFDEWIFASYDPRMNKNLLYTKVIKRDEKLMLKFEDKLAEFIEDMDTALEKAGFQFGDQWENYNAINEAA